MAHDQKENLSKELDQVNRIQTGKQQWSFK